MSRIRTVVATELLLVVGLVAFVGLVHLAGLLLHLRGPVALPPLASLGLSAVPAALWLGYFYLQDRHEPEPKHYVAGVCLAGAFVAAPVANFVIETLLPAGSSRGLTHTAGDRVLQAVLLVGLAQELAKYLVVRYTIYLSPEFDEPMDGIIYMTAAGIGFATAENVRYLQGIDGTVFLTTGAANAVVTTVAHACFAGVLGYALGRAKFSPASPLRRAGMLFLGLCGATALNGVFSTLEGIIKVSGLKVQPWRGLAWAAGFAALVFLGMSFLMRRQLELSPARRAEVKTP